MAVVPPDSQTAPLPPDLPFRLVSKTIGSGAYASIRKAVPLNQSSPVIAVKFINKAHAFTYGRLSTHQLKKEMTLHKYLGRHPNIIQYMAEGEDTAWVWMAMELADGGDLFDKIEPDAGVGQDIAHFYFFQLMNAVAFMHSKGVAHRDLKPENVLLSAQGDLKLADFGLAALFKKDGQKRVCNTVCGSPPYIAPEVVNGRKSHRPDLLDDGYEPNICDIWSCGVVLFVLLVGNTPWDEPTVRSEEYKEYVRAGGNTCDELWQRLPPDVLTLLVGMLTIDPAKRYTLQDIHSHPWFRRENSFISPKGTCANPVGLATQMLSQLRVDFTTPPSQSQRELSPLVDDMDIDSSPRRSNAPHRVNSLVTAMHPETPFADAQFDWERPRRIPSHGTPSQVICSNQSATVFSQLPSSTQEMLSQDPSMSQFSQQRPTAENYLTITQFARQFKDVLPPSTFCQLVSPHSVSILLPLIVDAMHHLGVPCTRPSDEELAHYETEGHATVRVKTVDSRRQALMGNILVERIAMSDAYMSEIRFMKASGDPLEWRRFFKKVVFWIGEGVIARPE